MTKNKKVIGVLALQGDVSEHVAATAAALKKLKLPGSVIEVRDQKTLKNIDAIIIPGGESTVLYKLTDRIGIFEELKKIKIIFGTCAGTIFLAKHLANAAPNQQTLALMDITVDRNAYGAQTESSETEIKTRLGIINAVFIRAPKIKKIGKKVKVVAEYKSQVVACEEQNKQHYFLTACFHPELTTTLFHEYFLKHIYE